LTDRVDIAPEAVSGAAKLIFDAKRTNFLKLIQGGK